MMLSATALSTSTFLAVNLVSAAVTLKVIPVGAIRYPVGITNCHLSAWYHQAPTKAVTLNQGTTEIMLALGLQDSMVGTAYIDDQIWSPLADAYAQIPVLSETYPTADQLVEVGADFLYASYRSAFDQSRVDYPTAYPFEECTYIVDDNVYCRDDLHAVNVSTYLQESACETAELRPEQFGVEDLFDEIMDIATIFNVQESGQQVINLIDAQFDQATMISELSFGMSAEDKPRVLWLDSINSDGDAFVGACCGAIQTILDHAGAVNVFEDLGLEERSSWATVSWDEVAATDPDIIVLVDAAWDTVGEKLNFICGDETLSALTAVHDRAYVSVPFSGSTVGVRIGSTSLNLAEAFASVVNGEPLSSVTFSNVTITNERSNGEVILSGSGVAVFPELPVYDGVDLDEMCPGENTIPTCQTISEFLCASPQFSLFCSIMRSTGMESLLSSGQWTVWAPTNAAFGGIVLPMNKAQDVFEFHLVANQQITSDKLVCRDVITMFNGKDSRTLCVEQLAVGSDDIQTIIFQKGADNRESNMPQVIGPDVSTCNGVIHIVDNVMLPSGFVPDEEQK